MKNDAKNDPEMQKKLTQNARETIKKMGVWVSKKKKKHTHTKKKKVLPKCRKSKKTPANKIGFQRHIFNVFR
jgi:hypothetical protein